MYGQRLFHVETTWSQINTDLTFTFMIDKQLLTKTVLDAIAGKDLFLVDISVSPDNNIAVIVDSVTGVDIDTCLELTHQIESVFDRDIEDYELEVGSAGLTSPFKVKPQYDKNIGNDVEVLTRDGRKLHGVLTAVADDFKTCTVAIPTRVKPEGAKRPVTVEQPVDLDIDNIKSITCQIKF